MRKYLDAAGVKYIWDKIVRTFVRKDGDKVLSDNNYSDEDKEKLAAAATKSELLTLKEDLSKVYSYQGTVETVADLENIENPENGDVYDVAENGANYAWSEAENKWVVITSLIRVQALSDDEIDDIIAAFST